MKANLYLFCFCLLLVVKMGLTSCSLDKIRQTNEVQLNGWRLAPVDLGKINRLEGLNNEFQCHYTVSIAKQRGVPAPPFYDGALTALFNSIYTIKLESPTKATFKIPLATDDILEVTDDSSGELLFTPNAVRLRIKSEINPLDVEMRSKEFEADDTRQIEGVVDYLGYLIAGLRNSKILQRNPLIVKNAATEHLRRYAACSADIKLVRHLAKHNPVVLVSE